MRIDVVTIFGEYLQPLSLSLIGKAQAQGLLEVRVRDLREHTRDRHRTVDDTPYGGGAGLLMKPEPWGEALDAVLADPPAALTADAAERGPVLLVPSPVGEVFSQRLAVELAAEPWLVFACGRYEGIDARVVEHYRTRIRVREVSLGDYVLNGGEVAVLAITEAVARLLPGVVGNAASLTEESHAAEHDGLLEHPAYTKPASWRGLEVPAVLSSGHHGAVERWRRDEALRRTARRRPDLLARLDPSRCDAADLAVLAAEGWVPAAGGFRPAAAAVAD
ncbi:tRNA (guanosine(37)-N1)-methyltransferase TrmD [Kineococcus sp. SYSU DK006]|uniref:tRNA (guanosine(37)-N1)-methyltransferase TrmD n=1 Tax=Kineococcus sp. SYSU DK006 TaxID=3383127 RepID=UPI003D7E9129